MKFQNRKTTITIMGILIIGSLFAVGYATSTVISDSGIITSNLTVTGTCTGCGGSGDFTVYGVLYNTTVTPTNNNVINQIKVANDGSSIYITRGFEYVTLNSTQAIIADDTTSLRGISSGINQETDQSVDGKYKIYASDGDHNIYVIKDGAQLQAIGVDNTQCSGNTFSTLSTGISGNGKFIVTICEDSGGSADRVLVFEGS